MKKFSFLLALLGLSAAASAQQQYLVTFKDKGPEAAFYRQHPEKVLSQRALERRQKHGVELKDEDLPLSQSYLKLLQQNQVKVLQKSKWVNAVYVETNLDAVSLYRLHPSIKKVKSYGEAAVKSSQSKFTGSKPQDNSNSRLNYGTSEAQITQVNIDCLHDQNLQGQGSLIAVFDTGYPGVNMAAAFDSLRLQNRVVATGNFVNGGSGVYHSYEHGTNVLSVIAANSPGTYVGAAPRASFALAITENMASETHQEELNWAAAAEWADSLGADIIQSSLSYRYFDSGQGDYTDADLDGNTAIITIAADKAASKGILVINSAGNDGMLTFPLSPLISPPSDGDSVLTVGAVKANGQYSPLSSVGPTADGRIKPDIMARGEMTYYIASRGTVSANNGTSLATPIISGLAACLFQANPSATNMQVYQAIIRSGDHYSNPNNMYGYGIPDACKADSLLKTVLATPKTLKAEQGIVKVQYHGTEVTLTLAGKEQLQKYQLYSVTGQQVKSGRIADNKSLTLDLAAYPAGIYMLELQLQNGQVHYEKVIR